MIGESAFNDEEEYFEFSLIYGKMCTDEAISRVRVNQPTSSALLVSLLLFRYGSGRSTSSCRRKMPRAKKGSIDSEGAGEDVPESF